MRPQAIRIRESMRIYDEGGGIIFVMREQRFSLRCSDCNSRAIHLRGSLLGRFKALSIGSKACWFEFAVSRVECLDCKLVRQVKIRFADGSAQHTV